MRGPNQPALDGFTIRRKGDAPTKVRIVIYLDQQPEQFKLHADLGALFPPRVHICVLIFGFAANILGIKEDSRTGVIQALWNYIKAQNLQDKLDRRVVRADARLRQVRFPFPFNPPLSSSTTPSMLSPLLASISLLTPFLQRSSTQKRCTSNTCPTS